MTKRYREGPVHRAALNAYRTQHVACSICGLQPTPDNPITVDHITPRVYAPELAEQRSNMRPACRVCNGKMGGAIGGRRSGIQRRARAQQRKRIREDNPW